MTVPRTLSAYPASYRAAEMARVGNWVAAGESGSVVGLAGAGKSNFLAFLCQRPDALARVLPAETGPVVAVLVDLNLLPSYGLATFFRVLLRALAAAVDRFPGELGAVVTEAFTAHRGERDAFVTQSALLDVLSALREEGVRLVLVLDRFDGFMERTPPHVLDSLRGLRDSYKDVLSLIVGMRSEITYHAESESLGELQELLDMRVCWIGAMAEPDAREVIAQETRLVERALRDDEQAALHALTGGHPSLLKACCHWWRDGGHRAEVKDWAAILAVEPPVTGRLQELWDGLTQAEQLALAEVTSLAAKRAELDRRRGEAEAAEVVEDADNIRLDAGEKISVAASSRGPRQVDAIDATTGRLATITARKVAELKHVHGPALARLELKGLLQSDDDGWKGSAGLLADFVSARVVPGKGTLWRDAETGELFQGQAPLPELPNLERRALTFFAANPRACHTKTAVIEAVWPDEAVKEGVMDDALYQVITGLRRKIEPLPAQPCYLVTWRGKPEGGYQFFPEGRPAAG